MLNLNLPFYDFLLGPIYKCTRYLHSKITANRPWTSLAKKIAHLDPPLWKKFLNPNKNAKESTKRQCKETNLMKSDSQC